MIEILVKIMSRERIQAKTTFHFNNISITKFYLHFTTSNRTSLFENFVFEITIAIVVRVKFSTVLKYVPT